MGLPTSKSLLQFLADTWGFTGNTGLPTSKQDKYIFFIYFKFIYIYGHDHCKGQQEGHATSLCPCQPDLCQTTTHTITVEFTDHTAARTQKKQCLITVYIKLNVILNIGLQIPGDLFTIGQLLPVPARVRVPLCQTPEAKSLSQPKESIQCSAFTRACPSMGTSAAVHLPKSFSAAGTCHKVNAKSAQLGSISSIDRGELLSHRGQTMPLTASMALGGWNWAPKVPQGSGVCPQQVPEGLDVPSPWGWDHSQAGDLSAELSMREQLPAETRQQLECSHHSPNSIHPSRTL